MGRRQNNSTLGTELYQHMKKFGPSYVNDLAQTMGATVHAINKQLTRHPFVFERTGKMKWSAPEWGLK